MQYMSAEKTAGAVLRALVGGGQVWYVTSEGAQSHTLEELSAPCTITYTRTDGKTGRFRMNPVRHYEALKAAGMVK